MPHKAARNFRRASRRFSLANFSQTPLIRQCFHNPNRLYPTSATSNFMPKQASREGSVPRKPVLRSSNGCAQCKRRKVKCDELHPECHNCVKHRIPCSFKTPNVPGPSRMDAEKLQEFELLHHFSTVTYKTLTRRRDVQELMQIIMPREAFIHDFLLHSLFAVSALHLAYIRPEKGPFYTDLAVTYQNRALKSYMTIAPATDESNCGAVLSFSSLVSIYSLALASGSPNPSSPSASTPLAPAHDDIEACIAWMNLTRGVGSVLVSAREDIRRSDFEILVAGHTGDTQWPLPEAVARHLDPLPSLWMGSEVLTTEHDAYSATNQSLRFVLGEIYHLPTSGKLDLGMSLSWLGRVPTGFVAMLTERKQVALVLLAYFCVVLDMAREFWCVDKLPRRLVASIYALLEEPYRAWMKWPLETVGATAS